MEIDGVLFKPHSLKGATITVGGGAQWGKTVLVLNFLGYLTAIEFANFGYYTPDQELLAKIVDTKFRPDVLDQQPWMAAMIRLGVAENASGKTVNRKNSFQVSDGGRKAFGHFCGMQKPPTTISLDAAALDEVDDIPLRNIGYVDGRMTGSPLALKWEIGTQRVAGAGQNQRVEAGSFHRLMTPCPKCGAVWNLEENFPQIVRVRKDGRVKSEELRVKSEELGSANGKSSKLRVKSDGRACGAFPNSSLSVPHSRGGRNAENGSGPNSSLFTLHSSLLSAPSITPEMGHDRDARYYCACLQCGAELDRDAGDYVAKNPDQIRHAKFSVRVSQLGISAISLQEIVGAWYSAMSDPSGEAMTAFYCDRIAIPHAGAAQPITAEVLERARGEKAEGRRQMAEGGAVAGRGAAGSGDFQVADALRKTGDLEVAAPSGIAGAAQRDASPYSVSVSRGDSRISNLNSEIKNHPLPSSRAGFPASNSGFPISNLQFPISAYPMSLSLGDSPRFAGCDMGPRCWFWCDEVQSPVASALVWAEMIASGNLPARLPRLMDLLGIECICFDAGGEPDLTTRLCLALNGLENYEPPALPRTELMRATLSNIGAGLTWDGGRGLWSGLRAAAVLFTSSEAGGIVQTVGITQAGKIYPLIKCNRAESIQSAVNDFLTPSEGVIETILDFGFPILDSGNCGVSAVSREHNGGMHRRDAEDAEGRDVERGVGRAVSGEPFGGAAQRDASPYLVSTGDSQIRIPQSKIQNPKSKIRFLPRARLPQTYIGAGAPQAVLDTHLLNLRRVRDAKTGAEDWADKVENHLGLAKVYARLAAGVAGTPRQTPGGALDPDRVVTAGNIRWASPARRNW